MENVLHYEQKMMIFKELLFIEDKNSLNQIQMFIEKFISELNKLSNTEIEEEQNEIIDEIEEDFDASELTFEEWNKQFIDDMDLKEFIPEYGMTLKEFRMKIYNSERDEGMLKEEFVEKVNQWK